MQFKLTNKFLLTSTLITGLLLIVFTEPAFKKIHGGIFNNFEAVLFEPLFVWSIALLITSIILLFFSAQVFNSWFKNIFRWYFPLALVITFLADTSVSYTFPNKVGFAMLLGELLVATTLVFSLVQKFVYKK